MKWRTVFYAILALSVLAMLAVMSPTAVEAGHRLFSHTIVVEGGSTTRVYSDSCDVSARKYSDSCAVSGYSDSCGVTRTKIKTKRRRAARGSSCDMQQFSVRAYSSSCDMRQYSTHDRSHSAPQPPEIDE